MFVPIEDESKNEKGELPSKEELIRVMKKKGFTIVTEKSEPDYVITKDEKGNFVAKEKSDD